MWVCQEISIGKTAAILLKVPDLTFAQPARRNLLAPVLLAFLILGLALALVLRYTPHTTAEITVLRSAVYPTHTVYKSNTIIVGRDQSQDELYVLPVIRVENRLNLPLFLKDFTTTLTTAEGEEITTSATEKQDLANLYTSFPALQPLSSEPLLRETLISPGQSAEGMLLLHFPVSQETWDHRKSATVTIAFYHQSPITIPLPVDSKSHTASTSN
jgi:hypothetical protein